MLEFGWVGPFAAGVLVGTAVMWVVFLVQGLREESTPR